MARRPPAGPPPGENIILPRRPNRLLAALPPADLKALERRSEAVDFQFEEVVQEPGKPIRVVFFPESGMFSSTVTMEDGGTVETGGTGHEGFNGIPLFYGSTESLTVVSCELPGGGRLLPADIFREELSKRGALYHAVARFTPGGLGPGHAAGRLQPAPQRRGASGAMAPDDP